MDICNEELSIDWYIAADDEDSVYLLEDALAQAITPRDYILPDFTVLDLDKLSEDPKPFLFQSPVRSNTPVANAKTACQPYYATNKEDVAFYAVVDKYITIMETEEPHHSPTAMHRANTLFTNNKTAHQPYTMHKEDSPFSITLDKYFACMAENSIDEDEEQQYDEPNSAMESSGFYYYDINGNLLYASNTSEGRENFAIAI
jgi:hypothetical protein